MQLSELLLRLKLFDIMELFRLLNSKDFSVPVSLTSIDNYDVEALIMRCDKQERSNFIIKSCGASSRKA